MLPVARWLVVFALMVSIGLHTVVIQSTAWVGMLIEYTMETGSVAQAVSDTFDGEHGCPMCQFAKDTAPLAPENNQAPKKDSDIKQDLIAQAIPAIIFETLPQHPYATSAEVLSLTRPHSPDTPPPRFFLA